MIRRGARVPPPPPPDGGEPGDAPVGAQLPEQGGGAAEGTMGILLRGERGVGIVVGRGKLWQKITPCGRARE